MPRKPCLDCRALHSNPSCCDTCMARRRQARDAARGTAAERGYDARHQSRRKAMLEAAYYTPCPECGELMLPGQELDAGHSTPLAHDPEAVADRIEHASCNRRAGARIRRRGQRNPRPRPDGGDTLPTIA